MPLYDVKCPECEHIQEMFAHRPELLEPCRRCGKGKVEVVVLPHSVTAIPDEIPGGMLVPHGICWPDGTPRRYYSRSEMAREAKRLGWENNVRHVTARGTDKSKHTTRWS